MDKRAISAIICDFKDSTRPGYESVLCVILSMKALISAK
jgi:hypothetical protein